MQIVLSDHNCEGQAAAIFHALRRLGYLPLVPLELRLFPDVGLPYDANDARVWRLCQHGYLLLTGNRRTVAGEQALETVLRQYSDEESLPVVTIGNLERVLVDSTYCQRCAEGLAEIVLDLARYRGVSRLYIPL